MNEDRNKKFFGEDWFRILAPILASKGYTDIGKYLMKLNAQNGIQITPSLKHVFRAFSECPYKKLHSIIIAMDPYNHRAPDGDLIADGLAFSARNCEDAPKSLNNIYEAIDTSVFDGEYVPRGAWNQQKGFVGNSLAHWADDGILLLNCALTTTVGRANEHMNLWKPFVQEVVRITTSKKDSLGVILMGAHAKQLALLIETNKSHQVFTCEHPVAGDYQKRAWRHEDVFALLTEFQLKRNNLTIDW